MHRNAASEINMVIRTPSPDGGYEAGCIFLSPLLTAHGVSAKTYDEILSLPDDVPDPPRRIPDESLWAMFESALPFRSTAWARETPLVDRAFPELFKGAKARFDPTRP
jgi:homogentisate 1,2-dioxygenase